ncbi:MAG: hypothetical protein ACRD0S_01490 [Acidimicrobiales bacterium]
MRHRRDLCHGCGLPFATDDDDQPFTVVAAGGVFTGWPVDMCGHNLDCPLCTDCCDHDDDEGPGVPPVA